MPVASCGPALRSALRRAAPGGFASFHCSARRLRPARVAVVLSGCGVYDGTEIHEASAILVHLSRGGAEVQMYAPDVPQMHVIDHSKGQPAEAESRNVLVESARIARGKIASLSKLTTADHDAVIFPGGFGAAKNFLATRSRFSSCKGKENYQLPVFHLKVYIAWTLDPTARDETNPASQTQVQTMKFCSSGTRWIQDDSKEVDTSMEMSNKAVARRIFVTVIFHLFLVLTDEATE